LAALPPEVGQGFKSRFLNLSLVVIGHHDTRS
jgi:hypothetical protein